MQLKMLCVRFLKVSKVSSPNRLALWLIIWIGAAILYLEINTMGPDGGSIILMVGLMFGISGGIIHALCSYIMSKICYGKYLGF